MDATAVCKLIQQHLATKLGVSPEAILPSERFRRLGVESLMATSMLTEIGAKLGRILSPTLAWQFPTPMELARHLAGESGAAAVPKETRRNTEEEPIAIVGLSCRFPRAPDKEAFWRVLHDGVDAIREVPRDRWDIDALYDPDIAARGRMATRFGGFLDDVASFDASFFGISPREAAEIDPQQRLMMELAWEALEDTGLAPASLKDTRTGVFFGAMWMDYTHVPGATADRIAPHTATGQDLSIVPARVSYTLGLLGPSIAVNTACSSSLVAVHLARQSLLRGESSLALAGAVNLILSPESTIAMSKFGAMAPDGRSKAFDARANGYVRGEGAGVVALKRLSDAIADGDRIYCVIRGSAINNDGFSNGLTAPSPRAQEAVVRDACADAGIAHHEVQYVEAHGTGTMLGDPIEAGALGAVLGAGRAPDRALRIGSVKTNIGHLEAAAGMAGLIKVALSMAHREFPASLHFQKPNPHIPFEALRIRVQSKREPWLAEGGRRVAGVSSFGFGGTNSHVVVESIDRVAPRVARLAASTPAALRDGAAEMARGLRASAASFDALPEPSRGQHRLAITGRSAAHLASRLEGFVRGGPTPGVAVGNAPSQPPNVVLVFGGEGAEAVAVGRGASGAGEPSSPDRATELIVLSGATAEAVHALAGRVRSYVAQHPELSVSDVAHGLMATRSTGDHRVALVVSTREKMLEAMAALSRGETPPGASIGETARDKVAWLFTGQGAQVVGMGRDLYGAWPAFREALDEAFAAVDAHLQRPLREVMWAAPASAEAALLDQTAYTQPALFAMEWALAALWRSWRVRPELLAGHSIGEITAACVAGVLTLTDAARLVCARGRLMQALPAGGAMMAIEASEAQVAEAVAPHAATVSVAAVNGPSSIVIAGVEATVLAIAKGLSAASVRSKRLVVSHAFHSPLMEPMLAEFRAVAQSIAYRPATIPIVSNVSGRLAGAEVSSPEYWVQHVRAAVRFADGVKALQAAGATAYIELGPRATLLGLASSSLSGEPALLASVQAGRPETETVLESLGALYVRGQSIEAKRLFPQGARRLLLPTTEWHWLGMGRALLRDEPVARAALERCDRALKPHTGWSLVERIRADDALPAGAVGPLLFALQIALAEALRGRGLRWNAVVGDGAGDAAAACVEGRLSLDEAARLVAERRPVPQASGASTLHHLTAKDATCVVEVGPQPMSRGEAGSAIAEPGRPVVVACSAGDEAEAFTLLDVVGRLFVVGCDLHDQASPPARSAELVALSAKTPDALRALATSLGQHVGAHPEASLQDLAYSLMTTRSPMESRLALAVPTREALREALDAVVREGTPVATLDDSSAPPPRVVFVFPGQGSQWLGMGRQLLAEEPAFAEALGACDWAISVEAGWSVLEELKTPPEKSRLDRIDVVQPVLFAMEVALAALWRSWGVEPHAVVGHSMGEVAAACVAGALSLEDGVAIICRRSSLMMRVRGQGEMALVELTIDEAKAEIAGLEDRLGVAVSNGARSTVLSGEPAALAQVLAKLDGRGIFTRRVKVDVASHSPQMDPLLDELVSKLAAVAPRAAQIPMRSTVTSQPLAGPELTARYWADNLRQPVRFADTVKALFAEGFTIFVEISPHPILASAVEDIRKEVRSKGVAAASLRRDQPERKTLLESLGNLYLHGQPLDAARLFPSGGRRVPLPRYPWQRQRHWLAPPSPERQGGAATGHPLLGVRVPMAGADAVYESEFSATNPPWLTDHRVVGRVFVPGAALVETVRAAAEDYTGGRSSQVTGLVLQAPLVVSESGSRIVQVVLKEAGAQAGIYSLASDAAPGTAWTLHATADVGIAPAAPPATVDLAGIRGRCTEAIDAAAAYARFTSLGLNYGPTFQGLRGLRRGPREALAEVALAHGLEADGYGVHPALLDAALQAVIAAMEVDLAGAPLPFEFGSFVVYRAPGSSALVHIRLDAATADGVVADLVMTDSSGAVVAEVARLRLRRADLASLRGADTAIVPDAFYRIEWPAVEARAKGKPSAARIAVAAVGDRVAAATLVDELRASGTSAELVEVARLNEAHAAEQVICLWDATGDADTALRIATEGLAVVKALARRAAAPRLWWVTRSAVAVAPGEDVAPAAAAAWGLGRTVMLEQPQLSCTLLDVGTNGKVDEVLRRELATGNDETQIAWRGETRHGARLVRAPAAPPLPTGENYRLETKRKGTLDSLGMTSSRRRDPGPGEVEIEIAASGLNFRDVLTALGMYPGEGGPLGIECAGVVSRVGANVKTVSVGDEVMALAQGSFSRFVAVDSRLVAPIPKGLSLEQAATVPIVFLTAWYALHDLGKLKRGDRVVIHAAAGGVGMAALQLAQWVGAEVLATASPAKWDVVRSLGVKHLASSRDASFVGAFRSATGGADVVLNALAGELVDASLSLLSSGGRFIEMGKTDIRDSAKVAAAHPGVFYCAFDLLEVGPERIAAMFAALVDGFATGHLKALPVRTFPVTEAEAAFRFMAQARHVGKLALVPARDALRVDGTALVTGGLGALGLEVARDLARRGMKHLVLTGRRGIATPGAPQAVSELEGLGARVTVAAVDVADREALSRILGGIPRDLPLRAVVHAAGLLDDGMLTEQASDRFRKVMVPKVAGAWNLNALTERLDLDLFVLFSSVMGTIGSAAQGAYSAANACLDALAAHRRAQGLPAMSLAWGPWAEVGMAMGLSAGLRARLAGQGLAMIAPAQGMALFDKAITRREAQLVVAPLDLRAAGAAFGASVPPVWRALVRSSTTRAAAASSNWLSEIAALPAERRVDAMTQAVRAEVARVLSLGRAAAVPADRPLRELGLDSLIAVELRNALGRRVGATLPANLAFDYPTPALIAAHLLATIPGLSGSAAAPQRPASGKQNGAPERPAPSLAPVSKAAPSTALTRPASAQPPAPLPPRGVDQVTTIPMGERWLADGFRVIPTPSSFAQRAIDMTRATKALAILAESGVRGTFTHLLVRASALALARNPKLRETIVGYRKITPGSVDIGLSMVGQTTYAPVVVLPAVERIPLHDLVKVVADATHAARLKETRDLVNLRRVGWMTPFGFFRQFVIRMLQGSFWFRRRIVGTFQVTSVPTVDSAVPLQFYAGSILSSGRVRNTAVAIDGRIEVRPMLVVTICSDYATVDGMRAAALLNEIAQILEGDDLVEEARVPPLVSTPALTEGVRAAATSEGVLGAAQESKSA